MKKLSFILLAALGLFTASCQDETTSAKPTVNPQLPLMTAADLQVTAAYAQNIDLTAANDNNTPVVFGTVTALQNVPEDYTLEFTGTLSRDEEYTRTANFPLSVVDGQLVATADDLEGAYVAAMGKSAKPKTVYFRVAASAVNGDATVRIGDPDYYVLQGSTTVTPFDLGIVIENGYGLLGTINGWSVANAIPMSNGGQSGYDQPIFKLVVSISPEEAEGGWWWKVVPQSTIDAGNWLDVANASFGPATNGDDALEGNLVPRTDTQDSQAGCVKVPGIYEFTIDMENQSYEFVPMYDFLYVVGDPSWSFKGCPRLVASVGGTTFKGFANLGTSFKFTDAPNWNGTAYGAGAEEGTLSTAASAKNIKATKGFYFVTADTEKLTYTTATITSCGLIGDFNGWGSQEALTTNDGGLTWTGTLSVTEGQGWKVRFNDDWGINLGGDLNNLTVDGANIVVPAGTYQVKLDLSTLPYTLTLN